MQSPAKAYWAAFFLVACVEFHASAQTSNDTPIEFVGGTNQTVIGSFGGSVTLKAELAQDDNVDLQWFHFGLAIVGAKSLTLSVDRLSFNDTQDPYVLQASNAAGVVAKYFSVKADLEFNPVFLRTVSGWVGPAGEEATLYAEYSQSDSVQWYFKDQKLEGVTNTTLTLALSPERVGTYYAVLSNATAFCGGLGFRPDRLFRPTEEIRPGGKKRGRISGDCKDWRPDRGT